MTKSDDNTSLRARASALLSSEAFTGGAAVPPEILRIVHELQVHQLELQLQNEELQRIRSEVEDGLARYTELYEQAPIGYVTLGVNGDILRVNRAATALLGTGRGPLLGQRLGLWVRMSYRGAFSDFVARLFEAGGRASCEVVLERGSDAGSVLVELTGSTSTDGRHARVVATDITELRRTSEALHDREVRYRTLFECSRDALLTLSPPDWRMTSTNRAARVMFDADEATLAVRTLGECSAPTQSDGADSTMTITEHLARTMREGSHSFDWTFKRGAGADFPAEVSLTRMDIDGVPVIHASIRDETVKRAALAHLSQADRLASMGMVAASVAHEINNPLAYVLTNVESLAADLPTLVATLSRCAAALSDRVDADTFERLVGTRFDSLSHLPFGDAVERATEALQGTRRIRGVAHALRTFSRVEHVERTRVDVRRAVSSALAIAENEIKYRARLVTDLQPVPEVWASEGKLSQVFLNLLVNAAHALENANHSEARITVKTWVGNDDDDGKDSVFIEIGDTGRGIAPENLSRVFEPFFTTKGVGKGSGLGLAICRNLITELGGSLSVTSTMGVGTQIVVRLPAATPPASPAAGLVLVTNDAPPPDAATKRGRVLVIDDEPAIQKTLSRLLKPNHEVVTVGSGKEAKALLTADPAFQAILCDLMMPEMTGMEFHAWLLRHDAVLAARVVFITGGAFTPKASDYFERFATPRLEKPFDLATLRSIVASLVASG